MKPTELYNFIRDYYGFKYCALGYKRFEKCDVFGILYDAFYVRFKVDEISDTFIATLEIGQDGVITDFLGKGRAVKSDPESIIECLDAVDRYCRLRLPLKFVEEFEKVYKTN